MPRPLTHLPIFVAQVTETNLGDDGRSIKAANEWIATDEVAPAMDGLAKMPPPAVDELVLVLQLDSTNLHQYYMPIRSAFSSLTADSSKAQIESAGDLELEGSNIKIGSGATEPAVLGDQLNSWLTDLVTEITLVTVSTAFGPSSPPLNTANIAALAGELTAILSGTVKVKD